MRCGDNKSVKDKIIKTLEAIERAEGVWEQNENWEKAEVPHDWGMKTKYASIPRSTGIFLKNLVAERKPETIIEIGTSVGYSTLCLALGLLEISDNPTGHIYGNEINTLRIELAKKHFEMAGVQDLITLFEFDAKTALAKWQQENQKKADFIFLDAFKRDYPEYLDLILPIFDPQGIIVIDNINTHANLLEPFFKKISENNQLVSTTIDKDNGIMLLEKLR